MSLFENKNKKLKEDTTASKPINPKLIQEKDGMKKENVKCVQEVAGLKGHIVSHLSFITANFHNFQIISYYENSYK